MGAALSNMCNAVAQKVIATILMLIGVAFVVLFGGVIYLGGQTGYRESCAWGFDKDDSTPTPPPTSAPTPPPTNATSAPTPPPTNTTTTGGSGGGSGSRRLLTSALTPTPTPTPTPTGSWTTSGSDDDDGGFSCYIPLITV